MEIFDYDNILLLPRKCRVESRSECDTSVDFGGRTFKLPVVPANMKTVLDESISEWLAAHGYFYVMHRFDLDNVAFAKRMREKGLFVSISSGVKPQDFAAIDRLAAEGHLAAQFSCRHVRSSQACVQVFSSISCRMPDMVGIPSVAVAPVRQWAAARWAAAAVFSRLQPSCSP